MILSSLYVQFVLIYMTIQIGCVQKKKKLTEAETVI